MALKKAFFLNRSAPIFLLALFLLASPLLADDEVKWTEVPIPAPGKAGGWMLAPGSDVQHLTLAADGALYAYGKGLTNTLYKSTDEGRTWAYTDNVRDSIVDIATHPGDPNRVYYATTSTVFRSLDGGKTFASLLPNPGGAGAGNTEISSIAVTRLTGNIIAVSTRDTDAGQSGGVYTLDEDQVLPAWTDTGLVGYDVYAIAFSPNYLADRKLLATATNETDTFVVSKAGGARWTITAQLDRDNAGASVLVANSAAIAFPSDYDATDLDSVFFVTVDTGTGNGDVYKVEDSATTDLNVGSSYGLSNADVTGLAVAGQAASLVLMAGAASSGQVYFSNDGGESWTKSRKEPTGAAKTGVALAPDFATSGRAYAATSGNDSAFSISRDKGAIWNQTGLIDTTIATIVDFAPSPDYDRDSAQFLLTFGGEHSLWRGVSGGWERVFSSSLPNVDSLDLVKLPPQYGKGQPVVFLAGSAGGQPAMWKSMDNGQTFVRRVTSDPTTGATISISVWAAVNENSLFIGSFDGSNGLVYETTNGGFSFSRAVAAGSQALNSIALSLDFEKDKTILIGNRNGWVYLSSDRGAAFEPLPPSATAPPLTGAIAVAFDPGFASNRTVYAVSNTANKGVYRFIVNKSTAWESIDTTLPAGATISQVAVGPEGALYATNSQSNGGMERSLDPTYSLGPAFETVTRGLSPGATLSGMWGLGHRLWAADTAGAKLLTFVDTLTVPITPSTPVDKTSVSGTLVNNTITNVTLDWESLPGATTYKWQLDYDTDFSSVPTGFEGTTRATSVRLPALDPATTYYWRVRATEPALSPWLAKRSFTTSLTTDSIALKLANPEPGASGVPVKPVFQWSAIAGAQAYELLVAADVKFASPAVAKTGDFALPCTAWQCNVSLDYDTTYYWKVRGIGAGTVSDWSATSAFTTAREPAAPDRTVPPPLIVTPAPVSQNLPPMPAPAPLPPSPVMPPAPLAPETPQWVVYVIGALLLTNLLLIITVLALVVTIRRL